MSEVPARLNPFRAERVEKLRYRLGEVEWTALVARLEELSHRAALVGPKGSGKTTLLEEIETRLEGLGWTLRRLRLSREHRRPGAAEWRALWDGAGRRDLVTVDGAEQLPWWWWRRLRWSARRAGGLLVTSHRRGLLPSLREHRTSPELLADLVTELVGEKARRELDADLKELFELHRGNVRDCLRHLYDQCAMGGPGTGTR